MTPPFCFKSQDSDLLVITILDENDNRPVFTRTSYRAEIKENSAAGITLCCAGLHGFLQRVRDVLQLYTHQWCRLYERCAKAP